MPPLNEAGMNPVCGPARPAQVVFSAEMKNIHVGPLDRQGPRLPVSEHPIAARSYPDID